MKAAKGSVFEREICTKLSLWISRGKDDDLFWRTAGSGGRATNRRKKGKTTAGHAGDVTNTDIRGECLIRAITIEIKRGYSKLSFQDLIDRHDRTTTREFEGFVLQARESATVAGTPYWMLIHRRDAKRAMVYMPKSLWKRIYGEDGEPKIYVSFSFRDKGGSLYRVCGTLFDTFLETCPPAIVPYLRKA
jgi:hypothetical protein